PIVDGPHLVGIVTRGDVLRSEAPDDQPLFEVASEDVISVAPGDSAQTALRAMIEESIEHVPVVEGGVLVGICTRTDLLKVRRRQLALERVDRTGALLRRRRDRASG